MPLVTYPIPGKTSQPANTQISPSQVTGRQSVFLFALRKRYVGVPEERTFTCDPLSVRFPPDHTCQTSQQADPQATIPRVHPVNNTRTPSSKQWGFNSIMGYRPSKAKEALRRNTSFGLNKISSIQLHGISIQGKIYN
jgi:hypothetical protein